MGNAKTDIFLANRAKASDAELITVCSECLCSTCWQGLFYCEKSKTANVVKRTRGELLKLGLEHPSYLLTDAQLNDPAFAGKAGL